VEGLTFPEIPFSNEFLEELRNGYVQIVTDLEEKIRDL